MSGNVSFINDAEGVYHVAELARFEWLEHGFGTRRSASWPGAERLAMLKQVHSAHVVAADGVPGNIGK